MRLLDHLEELRWRIIWSVLALVASVALGFYVVLHFNIIALLERPILPYLNGRVLVATHPTDGLQITISATMWIGCVLAFPGFRGDFAGAAVVVDEPTVAENGVNQRRSTGWQSQRFWATGRFQRPTQARCSEQCRHRGTD